MRPPRSPILLAALLLWALGCGAGVSQTVPQVELDDSRRALYARRHLEAAHRLRDEGRLEAAERATDHGLEFQPENARLHRLRALILEELGRPDEADLARERAEWLDPAPPPPPQTPYPLSSQGVIVVLLSPQHGEPEPERVPWDWPNGNVAGTLATRAMTRLPGASLAWIERDGSPGHSVGEARRWIAERNPRAVISVRLDRAFCGRTPKDGSFSMAWLRVATGLPSQPAGAPVVIREVLDEPRGPGDCASEAVSRAFERVLVQPAVRQALASEARSPTDWDSRAVRTLFPEIDLRIATELRAGRRLLWRGQLEPAALHFRRAVALDPSDPETRTYLREAEQSIDLARQLGSEGAAEEEPGLLLPHFSAKQRHAAEQRLAEEEERRRALLAALELLEDGGAALSPDTIAVLRPGTIRDPAAQGPTLARERARGDVEARDLYGPDGRPLARYFFAVGGREPALLEEASGAQADRWTAFRGKRRDTIWEDRNGDGRWDVRIVFAADGISLGRIEIDSSGNGRADRIFGYEDGRLVSETQDTTGNGQLDRFEHFDETGALALREEDVNGDDQIDVRTAYREGRIVRREILNPEAISSYQ